MVKNRPNTNNNGRRLKERRLAMTASKQEYAYYEKPPQHSASNTAQRHLHSHDAEVNATIVLLPVGSSSTQKYASLKFFNACHAELPSVADQWTITRRPHSLIANCISLEIQIKHLDLATAVSVCRPTPAAAGQPTQRIKSSANRCGYGCFSILKMVAIRHVGFLKV